MTNHRAGSSSGQRILLTVSLVLNLFLAGLIGGHLLRTRAQGPLARTPFARILASAEAKLSAHDAAAFQAVMQRDAPRFAASGRDLRQARQALRRDIVTEPFDQAAVRRDLTAWEAAWNRFMTDFSGPLVEALGQVSPEGRRKLVAARRDGETEPESP